MPTLSARRRSLKPFSRNNTPDVSRWPPERDSISRTSSTRLIPRRSIFPWAKFRRTKGGIKLHTLLDHDGHIPAFVHITTANVADVTLARLLKLAAGSIIAPGHDGTCNTEQDKNAFN
jgi:hypothetical protein